MSTFTPPVRDEVEAADIHTSGRVKRAARHMPARGRGVNVYYLSDGSVTEDDPDSDAVYWTAAEGSPYVVQTWWGSTAAAYTLTAAQASALTDAGYTVDA